jgi:hypothetical protein
MKNLVIMFIVAISLTVLIFIFPNILTGLIILLTVDIFAIFLYGMIKFRQAELMRTKYELEVKRRQDLEQEILKEIDLTNTIISRAKMAALGECQSLSDPHSDGR